MLSSKSKKTSRYRAWIGASKYVFAILLSVCALSTHKDALFLIVSLLEITAIMLITNVVLDHQKVVAYLLNSFSLLLVNIQSMVLFFGGSFVTLVMVTNLESIESLSGKAGIIGIGAVALLIFTFLPVARISIKKLRNSQVLSVVLLIQLVLTSVFGSGYSPLFAVYQLSQDAMEYQEQLKKIAKQPNVTANFYSSEVVSARSKPENLPEQPNVVLIFVEGLSQNIVDDPRGVMPNVSGLQAESINFTNYYNHTFATYRGLIGQLYSGYQLDNYDSNTLVSMQDILAQRGYQTTFINTEPANTQFVNYLENLHFQNLINNTKIATGVNKSITDQKAMEFLFETISEQHASGKPFFTAMYTYGTHTSFGSADKRLGDTYQPLLDRFFNFDYYFGEFVKKFRSSGLAKDTILVFTPDHATFEDVDFKATYPDYHRENSDVDMVPFFIYYDGVQAEELDVKGRNSLSLAPTILDFLDISEPNYFLGESLFTYKENNNSFDTVFFDNANLLSTDYGTISSLSESNEQIIKELLEDYFAAKTQVPKRP